MLPAAAVVCAVALALVALLVVVTTQAARRKKGTFEVIAAAARRSVSLPVAPRPTKLVNTARIIKAELERTLRFPPGDDLIPPRDEEVLAFLKRTPLSPFVADVFGSLRLRRLAKAQVLFTAGDAASSVVVVCRGELALYCEDVRIGSLRAGECSGHLAAVAFLEGKRHRTAIAATSDVVVAEIPRTAFPEDPALLLAHCRESLSHALRVADFAVHQWLQEEEEEDGPQTKQNDVPTVPEELLVGVSGEAYSTLEPRSMYLVLQGQVGSKRRGQLVGGLSFVCGDAARRKKDSSAASSSSSSSSDGARLLKIEDATVSSSGVVGEKLLAACIRAAAEEGRPLLERWARCGLSRRFLRAGERLDGEEDAAYLVLSGRLRSFLYDEKHRVANVRDFKRGDVLNVNEILLTQTRKRPFCVERCAARDTEIIVLPRAALDRFLPASCSLNLVRRQLVLKEEKQRSNRVTLATVDATVLCVLPTSPTTSQLARSLGEALAGPGDGLEGASLQSADNDDDDDDDDDSKRACCCVDGDDASEKFPKTLREEEQARARIATTWLADLERSYRRVVLVADYESTRWTRVALASADAVLVVVESTQDADLGPAEVGLHRAAPTGAAPRQLLAVCHDESTPHKKKCPQNTRRFLLKRPRLDEPRVLHLRCCCSDDTTHFVPSDVRRLSRFLTGRARGLVLGGGGARGLAHLGALRSLAAAGVEIDCVMGCSQGAMIGLLAAKEPGWPSSSSSSTTTTTLLAQTFASAQTFAEKLASPWMVLSDLNLVPFFAVSTFSGKAFARAVSGAFDDPHEALEDSWLPRYCVSTDVTSSDTRVHGCGDDAPVSCLASMCLVGYFPPVVAPADGHLLVDGGYACNLPVAQMRSLVGKRGIVFAVDVEAKDSEEQLVRNPLKHDWRQGLSGLRAFFARFFDPAAHISLSFLTAQLLYIRNTAQLRDALQSGAVDLCLRLDSVMCFNFTAYDRLQDIARIAQAESASLIQAHLGDTGTPRTTTVVVPRRHRARTDEEEHRDEGPSMRKKYYSRPRSAHVAPPKLTTLRRLCSFPAATTTRTAVLRNPPNRGLVALVDAFLLKDDDDDDGGSNNIDRRRRRRSVLPTILADGLDDDDDDDLEEQPLHW